MLYRAHQEPLLLSNLEISARHIRELQCHMPPFTLQRQARPGMWLPGTLAELGVVMLPVDLVVNPALISFGIPMMAAKRRATSMSRWTWSERPQCHLTHARGSSAHRWSRPNRWARPALAGT